MSSWISSAKMADMILPTLILAIQSPVVQRGTGAELVLQCEAADRVLMEQSSKDDDVSMGSRCLGYIDGYEDGATKELCIPQHTLQTIIRVYLHFMEGNPKYRDMPKAAGLRVALDSTYPCSK